jgi:hypothetical protein
MNKKLATTGTNVNSLSERLLKMNYFSPHLSVAQTNVLQYMVREIPVTNMTVVAIRDTIIDAGRW